MLVPAIYFLKSAIFLYLKSTMVICTYSVHITMANFSLIFHGQNESVNFSGGSFHVGKNI